MKKISGILTVLYWVFGSLICVAAIGFLYIKTQKPAFEQKLYEAIAEDDLNKFQLYQKLGADWENEVEGYKNYTPMIWIAENGAIEIYKYLGSKNLKIEKADINGIKPLFHAIKSGQDKFAVELIKDGAEVECHLEQTSGRTNITYDFGQIHAFHCAAEHGAADVCEWFIDSGLDVDFENQIGMTPLTYASAMGHDDVVTLLLEKGANPNHPSSPIKFAVYKKKAGIVSLLLEGGANPNVTEDQFDEVKTRALNEFSGYYGMLFPDLGREKDWMRYALTMAVYEENIDIVKSLLDYGADPNLQTKKLNTALHLSAYKDNKDLIKMNLEAGADKTILNLKKITASTVCSRRKKPGLAKFIDDWGSDS